MLRPIWIGERADDYVVVVDFLGCREPVGYKKVEAFALQEAPEGDTRIDGIVPVELP